MFLSRNRLQGWWLRSKVYNCSLVALFASVFHIYDTFSQMNQFRYIKKQDIHWWRQYGYTAYVPVKKGKVSDESSLLTPPPPPLTKADRFPLVFRVSIMSSTIWNRLQCGGTINKRFCQQLHDALPPTRRWQCCATIHTIQGCQVIWKPCSSKGLTGCPLSGTWPTKLWNKTNLYSMELISLFWCLLF